MSELSRRGFLGAATAITGAAAIGATAPAAEADTAHQPDPKPKQKLHRDLRDIKRVVILMQENRSFDHYYGSLRGVRGFGDRSTTTLPGGLSVFEQPTSTPGEPITATQFPWRLSDAPVSAYPAGHQPPSSEVGAQNYGGTDHSWESQHTAWYGGLMNAWYVSKGGPTTLGYLDRRDLPFHYALADAYTIGDAYHCSVLSATGPNRTYHWGGTIDAANKYSSFTAYSGGDELGRNLAWESYAETLQKAGVSWKVYQGSDNYGDNGVEYFKNFAQFDPGQGGTPAPGNVLYDNGVAIVPEPNDPETGNADNLALALRKDVLAGTLPEVSWLVTNQRFSEHPDGAPTDGAYYVHEVLKALNADPDVFNSTLVIINFDENDGQFDHVPPPVPAPGETDEFVAGTDLSKYGFNAPVPVGLGFRVPLLLVSPWTRGGWVTSEVSDHTSVIQFMEKWSSALGKPAICPNISDWRRRVCGDLTGAFDFTAPVFGLPKLPDLAPIGEPAGYNPPVTTNALPEQETGTKRARPLPYQPNANLTGFSADRGGAVTANLAFSNYGPHVTRASHFSVYNNLAGAPALTDYPAKFPGQYTVDASRSQSHRTVAGTAPVGATAGDTAYDITVVGPNRFLRHFTGDVDAAGKSAQAQAQYAADGHGSHAGLALELTLTNTGQHAVTFTVTSNHYIKDRPVTYHVAAHGHATHTVDARAKSGGWYDLSVTVSGDSSWSRRYVGHIEDGSDSITG
ncbi:phospholipase C [Streptomyces sp. DvalAA-14]|uniref:phosphocholine-specific phospholipase C n=1 Tax=unclassified Streptomyces TaxID=2593676 RepID=UPI00081B0066|nr:MULTISPECIES: phospholipase C, phosphocholine-specific [unclassified Streptomyces]MYS21103.1 phospholipase C, phosphocholine-specific [Streptomyces sp. SID4948]SCD84143.1 phospholipase C [Streptomyces sp. DvalAA-14]